jgi:hypothetical protein
MVNNLRQSHPKALRHENTTFQGKYFRTTEVVRFILHCFTRGSYIRPCDARRWSLHGIATDEHSSTQPQQQALLTRQRVLAISQWRCTNELVVMYHCTVHNLCAYMAVDSEYLYMLLSFSSACAHGLRFITMLYAAQPAAQHTLMHTTNSLRYAVARLLL